MPKRRLLWIILVVIAIAALAAAVLHRRSAPPAAALPAGTAPASLELLPGDVIRVGIHDLREVLPLSGALHAVNQASVKARVSGELREVLVREGEAVVADQVLAKMDGTEYQARAAQTRGALAAARGQLDIATKSRDNNRALLGKGFISQNAFDNAASQYQIAQANVDSARAALEVTQKALGDTTIRAPIAGLVSNRTVQPGEKVSPDLHLLDIVDLRQMEMEAAVPTSDIGRVALGQEVQVRIDGIDTPIRGRVARISPSTQSGSRSIIVYVAIDNPQGILKAGMFGEAQLTLTRRNGVLTVPASAVQTLNGAPVVYAIEANRVQRVPVTVGISGDDGQGGAVEIIAGVTAGTQVVRNNLGNLVPGTAVTFAAAVTTPARAAAAAPAAPVAPFPGAIPATTPSFTPAPAVPPGAGAPAATAPHFNAMSTTVPAFPAPPASAPVATGVPATAPPAATH